jgi:Spy/CpxP family protein refolding chaperone
MKKLVIGLVVAVAVGLIALPFAVAGPGGKGGNVGGPGYGSGSGGCRGGAQASQLTPEQTKKIDQLRQKHWEETKGLRADLFAKHQELRGLSIQTNPDAKAIEKLQKDVFTLQQKLQEKNFAFRQEMNNIAPGYCGGGFGKGYGQGGQGRGRHGNAYGPGPRGGGSGPRGDGSCWRQ